jgi:hypothetical protein
MNINYSYIQCSASKSIPFILGNIFYYDIVFNVYYFFLTKIMAKLVFFTRKLQLNLHCPTYLLDLASKNFSANKLRRSTNEDLQTGHILPDIL